MQDLTYPSSNPLLHSDSGSLMSHDSSSSSSRTLVIAIGIIVALYGIACFRGYPQQGTELVKAANAAAAATAGHHGAEAAGHDEHHAIIPPAVWTVIPFCVLLGCIAVLPLIRKTEHWWESNKNRFLVASVLGLLTLLYYLVGHHHAIHSHWPADGLASPVAGATFQWGFAWTVFANAILYEYIPFIVLLFSLYTISGGIRIEGNLKAHPMTNTSFIAVGGLLASFIGTTGAAMLLIRPLLETNKERKHVVHTVVFFIFVVCNCGGCLLPIGDPPLFLGYLRGVAFTWTLGLWAPWLFLNGMLLAVYFAWDHFFCYPDETKKDIQRDETRTKLLSITGWVLNVPLLIGVVFCVALLDPSQPVPGTDGWHSPMYLREICQLALVGLSLLLGSSLIRQKNRFNYHAIIEVAALFFGIFLCMQPALQILNVQGPNMGVTTPTQFFWVTGGLSSVLDNAPTYVVFFETAKTLNPGGVPLDVTVIAGHLLVAISLGAVFMGAMTYIGNGPNFMVKAIAEASGIRMPSFFGYMKYSFAVLLPLLVITTLLFLDSPEVAEGEAAQPHAATQHVGDGAGH